MFPLRPGNDDRAFEEDEVQPEFDPRIVDRLSAYTPGSRASRGDELPESDTDESTEASPPELDDSHELDAGPRFTYSLVEDRDRAVEEGHAASTAVATEAEPDEPGEGVPAPGSYESRLSGSAAYEAAWSPSERDLEEESGASPGLTGSIAHDDAASGDAADARGDDVPEPALLEAERSELDYEAEPAYETIPSFTFSFSDVGAADDEASADENEAELQEPALFEARSEPDVDSDVATDSSLEPAPPFSFPLAAVERSSGLADDRQPAEVDLPEHVLLEAQSPPEPDAPENEPAEAELPEPELPEPALPAAESAPEVQPEPEPEPEAEPETSEDVSVDAVLAEAAPGEEVEEPESSGRRSFRRRRTPRTEKQEKEVEKKERAPKQTRASKEKRGSRDRRAKRLVGLKIGASQIAAAQVVNNGAPELVEVFREPLEPGLVVSGEIRDPEGLGAALKRLFDLHKLPKRGVRLGLSNNRIGVRIFEIDGVTDAQQLDNAIRFRAEEVLPIPLDEAVLDYVVLEEDTREDGTPWKRILLVVAYREVVDRYLQACRSAGLEVVGIDLEAFALLRAVEAPMDRGFHAGALVAVAIGHDRSTIAVSTGRYCEFARVLDWGGWSLNVAIARELDRAPSEVEAIKRQLSFGAPTAVDDLSQEQAAKAREAIQRSLAGFVRELVASLQFYQAQPGALGIGEVVLTGGTAHMDGLLEALGELVGVPIRLGDPFKRVKVGPKVTHEGPRGSLSVAIGLGIED